VATQGTADAQMAGAARDFYDGVLRLTVVIAHDFQDFLVLNHFRLCNCIPDSLIQLKNLVLGAVPSDIPDFPYPLQLGGIKLEAIEGMLNSPPMRNDFELLLKEFKIMPALQNVLDSPEPTQTNVNKVYQAILASEPSNKKRVSTESQRESLIHAVVLYVCVHAIQTGKGEVYNKNGTEAAILRLFSQILGLEDRTSFVDAIINQLRFPNIHTLFFLHCLADLFGILSPTTSDSGDDSDTSETLMELIIRSLLDRLVVRPHPWGVVLALVELSKGSERPFWDLPFIKNNPEVCILSLANVAS
jgi:CCR4-NOT transcription complex subunit 1